jgi:regulator of sirC expression with transglutaminase-like and TPR domain
MTTAERFAALVQRPEHEIPLDEGALLIAAHAHPEFEVGPQLRRLDELAEGCQAATLDALLVHLFETEGFHGNTERYHDPDNSYLDKVLDRRAGIPITLSVLVIEVGRRLGLPLTGVGMPGHFLVRHEGIPPVYIDAFERGRMLDDAGCADRFHELYPGVAFDPRFLQPAGTRSILARMLTNLKAIFAVQEDYAALAGVLELRVAIPGMPAEERVELSRVLSAAGRFADAARELERIAEVVPEQAATLGAEAAALRARLN